MRLPLLVLVSGCGFQPQSAQLVVDAAVVDPDVMRDTGIFVTWDLDGMSGRGVPSSATQWQDLITNNALSMTPPNGLWLMQEQSGPIAPTIGAVMIPGTNTNAGTYRRGVPGWTRVAIATTANQNTAFGNNTASELPDVSTSSMTILVYYATPTPTNQTTSIVFGGSGGGFAEVGLDSANHFKLSVGSSNATGTVDHGTGVVPIILKMDVDHSQQVLYVDHEKVAGTYGSLASSRGLLLAAANHTSPEGRWLYMAAWYGAGAELTDAQVSSLLIALGW